MDYTKASFRARLQSFDTWSMVDEDLGIRHGWEIEWNRLMEVGKSLGCPFNETQLWDYAAGSNINDVVEDWFNKGDDMRTKIEMDVMDTVIRWLPRLAKNLERLIERIDNRETSGGTMIYKYYISTDDNWQETVFRIFDSYKEAREFAMQHKAVITEVSYSYEDSSMVNDYREDES